METERICPSCRRPLAPDSPQGLCPECLMQAGFGTGVAPEAGGPTSPPAFTPPSLAEMAKLFPQLEIVELLGRGGMGAVYRARQPALDRWVALKILPPQSTARPGFAERFNREARALARLNHANIVHMYDFGQAGSMPYFVMEYVEGVTLRRLVQERRLAPREALRIVPQICEALQFAHDEGVVHRDIKPENILLDKKGRVKIADFGIAKIVGEAGGTGSPLPAGAAQPAGAGRPATALTQDQVIGTPHYMAPEQVEHPQTVDHRADIYSLGVVFYEMLTGELPLGKFQPPSKKVQVDVRLDEVVLHTLEKEPERRYQHASELKADVETISNTTAPPPSNSEAFAREILARDYVLEIRSCLRRGWALVRSNFWPLAGITALVLVLLAVAHSFTVVISSETARSSGSGSLLGLLLTGPLMGGLYLYFLRKIRKETATVETAFSGFSNRFLHLFLGGFVTLLLTGLGFVCLILPGIYLLVAWIFTLPLIIDKRLDFWSAMELSRKTVSKHWWKFLGFGIVLLLCKLAGLLACGVGIFVMYPIALAALMYAYEDIFRSATIRHITPAEDTSTAPPAQRPDRFWRRFAMAVALVLLALILIPIGAVLLGIALPAFSRARMQPNLTVTGSVTEAVTGRPVAAARVADNRFGTTAKRAPQETWTDTNGLYTLRTWPEEHTIAASAPGYKTELATLTTSVWGSERAARLDFQLQPTNASLALTFGPVIERVVPGMIDLETGTLMDWPLPEQADEAAPARYAWINDKNPQAWPWMRERGIDAVEANHGLLGVDLVLIRLQSNDWQTLTPEELQEKLRSGPVPQTRHSANFDRMPGTYAVRTREGSLGVLEVLGTTDGPRGIPSPGVKIRYKLVQSPLLSGSQVAESQNTAAKIKYAKYLGLAAHKFAADNDGLAPANPSDLATYLLAGEDPAKVPPGFSPEEFEIVYRGRLAQIENASKTIILREKQATQTPDGQEVRVCVFADGHVESQAAAAAPESLRAAQPTGVTGRPLAGRPADPARGFGPETEVTLTEFNNMDGQEALDLETGTVFAQPNDLEKWSEVGLAQWIKENGIDLFVDHGPGGQWGLLTTTAAQLKLACVTNENWATISERELDQALLSGHVPASVPPRGILKAYLLPKDAPSAMTLAFKTSSGGKGLLRVARFTEKPRGVKLRYKLVQAQTATAGSITNFHLGPSYFPKADSLEIISVERSQSRMTVRGRYQLVSADHARLALYITTTNASPAPADSRQRMKIFKGRGDFELVHPNPVPGLPHVGMYPELREPLATLYFGTGAETFEAARDLVQLTQEGWQLWRSGRPYDAIPKFERAVKLDPNNPEIWNGLAWANMNSGKMAEAEKPFQKVIELEPTHPAAFDGLGQIYLSQDNARAEAYRLKADPKAPAAWYGLARLYLLQGKFEQAEKWAQMIVDSDQGDEGARAMLQAAKDKKLSDGLRLRIQP